jgi:hypothetical protein
MTEQFCDDQAAGDALDEADDVRGRPLWRTLLFLGLGGGAASGVIFYIVLTIIAATFAQEYFDLGYTAALTIVFALPLGAVQGALCAGGAIAVLQLVRIFSRSWVLSTVGVGIGCVAGAIAGCFWLLYDFNPWDNPAADTIFVAAVSASVLCPATARRLRIARLPSARGGQNIATGRLGGL